MRTYQVMVQLVGAGLPIQLGSLNPEKAKEAIRALRPAVIEGLVHAWSLYREGIDREGWQNLTNLQRADYDLAQFEKRMKGGVYA